MASPIIQFKRGAFANLPGLQAGEPGFTTDKYDLFVGLTSDTSTNKFFGSHRYWGREDGSTSLRLNLVDKNGNNSITIKAPNTLAGVGTYTLPDTNTIVDGYFLKVASNGTLSWDTIGGSGGTFSNSTLSGITTISGTSFDVNVNSDFSGIVTFSGATGTTVNISSTQESTNKDTGALVIEGGVGIEKNLNIGGNFSVQGTSEFVGVVTFKGGTLNLGDGATDNINVVGGFISNLVPNADNTYDIGVATDKRWRNANFSGIGTFNNLQISQYLYDSSNSSGAAGQFLVVTNTGIGWTTISGVAAGTISTAARAETVDTVTASNANSTHYLTFVNSHNGTTAAETVYTDDGIYYNPGTNTFTTQHASLTGTLSVSGITTFSSATDNTLGDVNTGAVQIDGGLGVDKNVTVGGGLSVTGQSYFIGTATFYGGQLNLGDNNTDNINVAGEFVSNLVPNTTNTYDLGLTGQRWRNGFYSGNVDITGNLVVDGNVTVGSGGTVILHGEDVYIRNKDIILGYTTSISGADISTDDTANHAGVAIASTVGSPLVSFTASGINTLPDTYKQMMWFHSGTLGFSTDAFAFNYGVAIGTTSMANGVRLAVGSNVTVTDNTVNATTGSFTNISGTSLSLSGVSTVGTLVLSGTSGIGITGISTSTTLAENSNSFLPTQAAVKSYVDAIDLTLGITADSGGPSTVATSQTLTISGTAGEVNTSVSGQIITVGLPDDVVVGTSLSSPTIKVATVQHSNGTQAAVVDSSGNITASQNLTINGNLYVSGSTTQVNTAALTVEDRTIDLGIVNGAAPSANTTWDLGVLFNYYTGGAAKKSAVVWEHGDSRFKFASVLASDTDGSTVDTPQLTVTTFAPIEVSELWVNNTCTGGSSQVIACSGANLVLQNITIDGGTF